MTWEAKALQRSIEEARRSWGTGWRMLSLEQRRGAVAMQACAAVVALDEDNDSVDRCERVRAFLLAVQTVEL